MATMKKMVVHAPTCRQAEGHTIIPTRQASRYALPHLCLPNGIAGAVVVEVAVEVPEHQYQPSMIWPAGEKSSLCRVCRNPQHAHEEA